MKRRIPDKVKTRTKEEHEAFLNETSANFLEKQGVPLWEKAQRTLVQQVGVLDEQSIFEMGLRLGWKAALRAALTNNLPKDDNDD